MRGWPRSGDGNEAVLVKTLVPVEFQTRLTPTLEEGSREFALPAGVRAKS